MRVIGAVGEMLRLERDAGPLPISASAKSLRIKSRRSEGHVMAIKKLKAGRARPKLERQAIPWACERRRMGERFTACARDAHAAKHEVCVIAEGLGRPRGHMANRAHCPKIVGRAGDGEDLA